MARVKKHILITGAKGFVGRNLVERFEKKYKLYTPNRKQLDLLDEKMVDAFFKKHKIDIVIHAAVVGGSRTEERADHALQDNLRMFFNIVKHESAFKRLIFLGSGAEYDKRRSLIGVRENEFGKQIPVDEYGFAKYVCSKYIEKSKKIINLRIFGLYGKYEDYRYRFISNAICQSICKQVIVLNQNVIFDYVYIDDFVKIIDYFIRAKRSKHSFYNIGAGRPVDLRTIANEIGEITGNNTKIFVKKTGLNKEYSCNNSRLLQEIRGLEFTDQKVAIASLYKWYKKQKIGLI